MQDGTAAIDVDRRIVCIDPDPQAYVARPDDDRGVAKDQGLLK